ncbi:MAG: hypothetical protein JWP29_3022 [Rhodoferax sp.]|nr:hypothetical protein [Rhodoferax sp.]
MRLAWPGLHQPARVSIKRKRNMQKTISSLLLGLLVSVGMSTGSAHAQSEASAVVSMLPVASVVVGSALLASSNGDRSASATNVGSMLLLPAVLVVEAVKSSATKTVYVLKRASDGASVAIEVVGTGVSKAAVGVGTAVTCSVTSTGTVLSTAGDVLAFIPNQLGKALLHNERLM